MGLRGGIIGINERNVDLVAHLNPRRLHHLVNDKMETKRLAEAAGIPAPRLLGSIANGLEMRQLPTLLNSLDDFVIKPAQGAQGNGILVVDGKQGDAWRLANGRRIDYAALKFHISNIVSGMYSLGGRPDVAFFEERVQFDPAFDHLVFKGVPDIRVIVVKGYPVAGMLRLPTAQSDGKANLHKGGLGVGIDIATGITRYGMQNGRPVTFHPDTGNAVAGMAIPGWPDILMMSAQTYEVTRLGYLGADMVLDRRHGPLLLELNARPGLSIQIAERKGLRDRIKRVLSLADEERPLLDRIALARELAAEALDPQSPAQDDLLVPLVGPQSGGLDD